MLLTLIQKEMMHHILSARFVALLVMCLLLVPLTLHINYRNYLQNQANYQAAIELSVSEMDAALHPLRDPPAPDTEFSKLFLEPTPLSVFAKGLEESLPGYLGMTRNGVKHGSTSLGEGSLSSALGNLDFLFVVSTVFSLLALLFTFDAVAGEREAGTLRVTLANALPRMEKTAINSNLNEEKDQVVIEKMRVLGDINLSRDQEKIKALRAPIDAEYRQKFQEQVGEIERAYQREKKRQESVGETLSRITPTASLIYVAMNLTETGKIKRDTYFETGARYYNQLEAEYFHEISDDQFARFLRSDQPKPQKISPPPDMTETRLSETVRHSTVDLLLLCFLAVVLTTVAFLKFFSVDI